MRNVLKTFVLFLGLFLITTVAYSQKIGYINSQALLAELSEVKQARSSLETFQKQLQSKGQKMVESFQTDYKKVSEKVEKGTLSPLQQEQEGKRLKEKEMEIAKYEQEMKQQIISKEQTLLQPILDKVNVIIKDVAKEKGYQYILDSSQGVILYADESNDITGIVKTKLGVN